MIQIEPDAQPSLVVTGSSAGGIEALRAFVAGLPADFGAPVVLAQHLNPAHASHLKEIFAGHSALPVVVVAEPQTLRNGTIYVVPADRDVIVGDGAVRPIAEERIGPKPSIDRLFESAAQSYEDRLVAIVFSGMGSDGLAGARAVKQHGGTVIVQDPHTAAHPSMPLAIPPALLDLSVSPDSMGMLVANLVNRTRVPEQPSDQALLRTLLMQLRDRSGIDFTLYKTPTILRRLSRLMLESRTESLAAYMRYLEDHPEAYQRLKAAFLIKVTSFFRDAGLFAELKEHLLPRLIAESGQHAGKLRIWSAGTSTGEEAYSLAILCAELLREAGSMVSVQIFATDLDETAIAFARRGVYSRDSLQNVPQEYLDRYFTIKGQGYEVVKLIRNMTIFGHHNLGQRPPFPNIDLCLCRNVLIYFTSDLQLRALQLFAFALRDGGILALGKSESVTPLAQYFRTTNATLKIFQRHGDRILMPPTRIAESVSPIGDTLAALKDPSRILRIPLLPQPFDERPKVSEAVGALIATSPLGAVIVDKKYRIVSMNNVARSLLDIRSIGIDEDLIHLAETVDQKTLRVLIDAAFRGEAGEPTELRVNNGSGDVRWIRVLCHANHGAAGMAAAGNALVVVMNATGDVGARVKLEDASNEQAAHIMALTQNVDAAAMQRQRLLQANDGLKAANDTLRDINEELIIRAEEAMSSHEEVQTLNEEMQATNEELETVNEELQATIEELNTTNEELWNRAKGAIDQQEPIIALSALAPVFAIVDEAGKTQSASPIVADWIATAGPMWWKADANVVVADTTYELLVRDVEFEQARYHLVLFRGT
jgi:two-component system CheB/CheR fusion protein